METAIDRLPTEIIFLIFNYLSNNDIIYTFFFLSQRFNNLLLQNQCYFNYFELPTINLNLWKNILTKIASRIECLNINLSYLSFPIKYFSNLKSIIISSPYGLPDEELKSIIENNQFQNLYSFKIKENRIKNPDRYNNNQLTIEYMFEKIFNTQNSLKILQCSIIIPESILQNTTYFQTNYNLHSLTLRLTHFSDIFSLIEYMPNLKYLNVQSRQSFSNELPLNMINIKLEQFHLTLNKHFDGQIDFNQLINAIKHFSSSLTCLSLNLAAMHTDNITEIPYNGKKFQQFLESMTKLKQFYLYARLGNDRVDQKIILSQFENQYWIDHNWLFGMRENYLFTLPFHFDYLYGYCGDFDNIQSNNRESFNDDSRLWSNIKTIEWLIPHKYDLDLVKKLKIKMPKLTSIEFNDVKYFRTDQRVDLFVINDEKVKLSLILDTVTSIEFTNGSIEDQKYWIIYSLPNLRHLILRDTILPLNDSELISILNDRIQRLDIHKYSYSQYELLKKISSIYFSSVQYINICLYDPWGKVELFRDVKRLLTDFRNLKTLLIYVDAPSNIHDSVKAEFRRLVEYLNGDEIMRIYKVKYFPVYCVFVKREYRNSKLENHVHYDLRGSSCFSSLIRCFQRNEKS